MQQKLLSQFQRDMQLRGLGELTQQAYLNNVGKFYEFFGKSPRRATAQDVNRYLRYRLQTRRDRCTQRQCISVIGG